MGGFEGGIGMKKNIVCVAQVRRQFQSWAKCIPRVVNVAGD